MNCSTLQPKRKGVLGTILRNLVVEGRSFEQTYKSVLEFDGWKVGMLRYFDDVDVNYICRVERHWNTNEVFILTAGKTDLILFEGDAADPSPRDQFHVIPMELNVAYDIQKSVWHHVVMSEDAHIIIFERSETGPETTDFAELSHEVICAIREKLSP